jgi:RimJ/RimL family protein N-acetyltransferase
LRAWRGGNLEPFAAMNADAKVMELYPAPLSRAESEAFAEPVQQGIDDNGFGLYAAEVKAAGNFIGHIGLSRTEFAAPLHPGHRDRMAAVFRCVRPWICHGGCDGLPRPRILGPWPA